jgi:PST family polysaccharide transporter/lipopolysaccharide exporter
VATTADRRRMSGSWLRKLLDRVAPGGGTTSRVVKSGMWLAGQNAFGRLVQLAMLVVLARLIGPESVGIAGIVLLVLSATKRFTNIGLDAALIQNEDEDVDRYLDTTWLLMSARGVVMALVMVASAPLIADVFDKPSVEPLVRVMAISPLFVGLRNPGVVYFQKNLEFHKQFVYKVSGEVVQFFAAVGYALVNPTAEAFVVGYVVSDGFRFLLSYVIQSYRPRPVFDRALATELVDYGKWVTGNSMLYFLYSEGDDAVVGWLLGPAALSFYQYAYRFSNAPATELTQVISSVMFPTFSHLQDEPGRLRDAFLKTMRINSLVAFPAAFGIAAVAPSFVRGFLGPEWVPMITLMQVLAVFGLLRALTKPFGSVWKAVGRPDIITKLSLLRVGLLATLIYPVSVRFGAVGTAGLVTGVYLFPMLPLDLWVVGRTADVRPTAILGETFYPMVAASAMCAAVWGLRSALVLPALAEFAVLVLVGVVCYLAALAVLEAAFDVGFRGTVETVVTNLRA